MVSSRCDIYDHYNAYDYRIWGDTGSVCQSICQNTHHFHHPFRNGKSYRFEDVKISAGSKFIGQTLSQANLLHNTRVLIVAMKEKGEDFVYNPERSSVIKDESVIVVMGESLETKKVREWVENQ